MVRPFNGRSKTAAVPPVMTVKRPQVFHRMARRADRLIIAFFEA